MNPLRWPGQGLYQTSNDSLHYAQAVMNVVYIFQEVNHAMFKTTYSVDMR
jgi:hypothetical protein